MRTLVEMMKAAIACTTKEQAKELTHDLIVETISARPLLLDEEARAIVLHNIGYMTGYVSRAEAGRLLELFETRHPYFGAIEDWPKTPEETFEMGRLVGQRMKLAGR